VRCLKVGRTAHSARGRELLEGSHVGARFVADGLGNLGKLGILFSSVTHVSGFLGYDVLINN
jgi:hypothetical protein